MREECRGHDAVSQIGRTFATHASATNEFQRAVLKLRLWPIRRYRDIGGWLSGREALALYRIVRDLPPDARLLEIGSWKGKSTVCIARGLRGGVVYALDPFNAGTIPEGVHDPVKDRPLLEQFKGNLARFGVADRVQIRPGDSQDYAGTCDALDFLFIDGDHTIDGCRHDYETSGPVVKPGGWPAFTTIGRNTATAPASSSTH